jgi:hypothetical protein
MSRITEATFILRAAHAAGIRVGTDGKEVVMLAPLKIPRASRLAFEAAIHAHQDEIISLILAKQSS